MTARDAEQLLGKFTDNLAASMGFHQIDNDTYGRTVDDATALLFFPYRLTRRGVALTARVGLRFESLAKWLDKKATKTMPTVAVSINLLREDTAFTEWEFSNADDLESLRDVILSDIRQHALPFIDRYSRLADLRKALESPNNQDWYDAGFGFDDRVTTLAAIQVAGGDKAGAITTLDDGIKALEELLSEKPYEARMRELRKRSCDMEYLRRRLLANS